VRGSQSGAWLYQGTQRRDFGQGGVGGAERDGGWQRPAGGLGYGGTAVEGDAVENWRQGERGVDGRLFPGPWQRRDMQHRRDMCGNRGQGQGDSPSMKAS